MQTLIEDIQFAYRSFMKTPAVCALIVTTLALGIGANAAIFNVVYNVLVAPLPFSGGERLVKINTNKPKINRNDVQVSVPTMLDYRQKNEHLSHLVEYHQMSFTLLGHGDPKSLKTGTVSWDYFEMLNVKPILGRTFLPGEDKQGARPLIVLSHHYWREMFGSDPDIIGTSLQMNNKAHQVIGVLPPMAAYPVKNDIWVTAPSCPVRGSSNAINDRSRTMLTLYGKLKANSSLAKASLELNNISKHLIAEYPDVYPENQGLSNTLIPLKTEMAAQSGPTFYLLMAITALVLLIACANVANLNLVRTANRKQEFAIREALGANPRRIARQVLTESILLSLTGGLLGLIIAIFTNDLLAGFAAHYTSLASEVKINWSVFVFCLVISMLTGVISGATAAFQKRHINESLKEGSGNITASGASNRLRKVLLIIQFSLAFIVITSATLVSLSLYRLNNQDTGFNSSEIVALQMGPGASNDTVKQWHYFARETAHRLERKAEIEQVAFSTTFPMTEGRRQLSFFQIEGRPPIDSSERPDALRAVVSPNYHQVLAIPLLQGRYLQESDDENNPGSILINKRFAELFFAAENPIDKRISLDKGKTWLSVRGVVADTREMGVDIAPVPTFYSTFIEYTRWSWIKMLIRTKVPLNTISTSITDAIHEINPQQAVQGITTLKTLKDESLSSANLVGQLVTMFAVLAFAIALSGVVGIVAYNVSQRRKEIGIRVALGANPKRIRMLFAVQGMSLCAIGIAIGAFIMVFISPMLARVLFETQALNLSMYLITGTAISLFAALAILLPVKQATAVQPSHALREQ
ncbi:ABC transporter permease [Thalassomonas actiniarum]|uniref:ABC transporter permease n=1 Tax=Thalassomonas actiniarum TaxID=485447 RepID=A0AAF0C449_9GAMM|nr:ABC transporter permease [Thalassomonas actiniarum]WDD99414.1 ABC transporter permease [Thalassomonas actiniarum]